MILLSLLLKRPEKLRVVPFLNIKQGKEGSGIYVCIHVQSILMVKAVNIED